MHHIAIQKQDIDLVSVIEACGVQLSHKYCRHVGLCPFHSENTPSFYIFSDNRYHCFGCGAHGDVIDFVQHIYGFSFKEALQHLGIETGKITAKTRQKIIQLQEKRAKKQAYQKRERDLAFTLGTLIRWTHTAMDGIKAVDDMEAFADVYHTLPFWKYCHNILCQGDHQERCQVIDALEDMEMVERNPLFKADFDFSAWLREFINGVPQDEQQRIKISIS